MNLIGTCACLQVELGVAPELYGRFKLYVVIVATETLDQNS